MSNLALKIPYHNSNERDFQIQYDGPGKFYNDCIYVDNEEYLIVIDGVILNKNKLLNEYAIGSWEDCIKAMHKKQGDTFFKQLKGSYYGVLFGKKNNEWIVFTDHIGSKPMYYHKTDQCIYLSNNYTELVRVLKSDGIDLSLNEESAYLLLTYGYVFEKRTILKEINRLLIGYYGKIKNQKYAEHKFFEITNKPIEISEYDAIEEIDIRFRNAIEIAFEKDIEYGFKHLVSLSGGLDSRMTSWVAHDMGYTDQLNITFSQSDYLDETIPKQIAADLKHEWLFKALDNGLFLKDVDEITRISGGNVLYYGLTHSNSLYKYLKFKNLGLLHSGQLGDVILGTYSSKPSYNHSFSKMGGGFSTRLENKFQKVSISNYENEELHKMNIRGFYGINMGLLPLQKHTETYSPFYDVDFMNYALSIPIQLRFDHKLYKRWVMEKYPKAANYVWESKGVRITDIHIKYQGREIPARKIPQKFLRKIGLFKTSTETKFHMNPLSYWYNNNDELKKFQDRYFTENIDKLDSNPELKQDCYDLYKIGNGVEKNQAISLLAALKNIKS